MLGSAESRAAIVLTSLPAMNPQRLRSLLHGRTPTEVLAAFDSWPSSSPSGAGPLTALLSSVPRSGGQRLGDIWHGALEDTITRVDSDMVSPTWPHDMEVSILGDARYPAQLCRDSSAPAVLFTAGDRSVLDHRRVGIVGTRHATAHGRACAHRFGDVLSRHGVSVVSGLARGIDVYAHRGVVDRLRRAHEGTSSPDHFGRPLGVVASGLDVVYPPEHGDIWQDIMHWGLMVSESPPRSEPLAYRFPLRNRIIAALCDVLVVVESHVTGGSMITVREALDRGVTVMAVPGSTSTRAAEGTNLLIRDGASIAVEPEDVLAVLDIEAHRQVRPFDPRPPLSSSDADIVATLGNDPMTLDHVVAASKRSVADVAVALGRLEAQGWVMCTAGWFERVEFPLTMP